MSSNNTRLRIRVDVGVEKELRNLYKARCLDVDKVSWNEFLVDILKWFRWSKDGEYLMEVYNDRLFAEDKEGMRLELPKVDEEDW